jgi:hypothetical protein
VAFNPQANYTNWVTATCWRILVPTSADIGVSCGQRGSSLTVLNLSFPDRNSDLFFQVAPHLSSRGWVDPIPDPLLIRKSGIESRTSGTAARNSDHLTTEAATNLNKSLFNSHNPFNATEGKCLSRLCISQHSYYCLNWDMHVSIFLVS